MSGTSITQGDKCNVNKKCWFENLGIDGKIILKWIIGHKDGDLVGLAPMVGSCEYGNESSGSLKVRNSLMNWIFISFWRRPGTTESGYQLYLNAIFYLSRHDQSDCAFSHQDKSKFIYECFNVRTLYSW